MLCVCRMGVSDCSPSASTSIGLVGVIAAAADVVTGSSDDVVSAGVGAAWGGVKSLCKFIWVYCVLSPRLGNVFESVGNVACGFG